MKLNAVHHVALIVSDYDKSRDFYVNKLGFEIIRENHRPERHDYKLDLKCGTIELEIFGNKTSDPAYVAPPKTCWATRISYGSMWSSSFSFLR